jgi:biopolymer transport protein ExbB
MSNSLGMAALWSAGDWVSRSILGILLGMSVLSWVVILYKGYEVWRHKRGSQLIEPFWHSSSLVQGIQSLNHPNSDLYYRLARIGQEATEHHQVAQKQLHDKLDLSDWVSRSLRNTIDDNTMQVQSGLAILASIGSTAPFVGLFGTVWGIYHALTKIGTTGSVALEAVAGPIGETLIMTALGLAVAIPAVLGYNALVRGNKFLIARMNRFAPDLHAYFVTGARVAGATSSKEESASHVV